MEEVWKEIKWYEWKYHVSNMGNVKSINFNNTWKCKNLSPWNNTHWYLYVVLCKSWKTKPFKIHRLVAQAFIPNKEKKEQVNHINWDRSDNELKNLEWSTPKENIVHSYINLWNKKRSGVEHHNSREVLQYSRDKSFIRKWWSMSDVQRILWIHVSSIWSCCKWKLITAWGFIWRYN